MLKNSFAFRGKGIVGRGGPRAGSGSLSRRSGTRRRRPCAPTAGRWSASSGSSGDRNAGRTRNAVDWSKVTAADLRRFFSLSSTRRAGTRGEDPSATAARRLSAVRTFFAFLVSHGGDARQSRRPGSPRPRRSMRLPEFLPVDEMDGLPAAPSVRDDPGRSGTPRSSSSCTPRGCGSGSSCSLRMRDVSLESSTVRVTGKGRKVRVVPVGGEGRPRAREVPGRPPARARGGFPERHRRAALPEPAGEGREGSRARGSRPRSVARMLREAARRAGRRDRGATSRPTGCGTPSRPTSSSRGRTCGRSRRCSGTPRCRRRSGTRGST